MAEGDDANIVTYWTTWRWAKETFGTWQEAIDRQHTWRGLLEPERGVLRYTDGTDWFEIERSAGEQGPVGPAGKNNPRPSASTTVLKATSTEAPDGSQWGGGTYVVDENLSYPEDDRCADFKSNDRVKITKAGVMALMVYGRMRAVTTNSRGLVWVTRYAAGETPPGPTIAATPFGLGESDTTLTMLERVEVDDTITVFFQKWSGGPLAFVIDLTCSLLVPAP